MVLSSIFFSSFVVHSSSFRPQKTLVHLVRSRRCHGVAKSCPITTLVVRLRPQTRRNHFGLASTGEPGLEAFECQPLDDRASSASWIRYWRSITSGHLRAAERTSNFAFLNTQWTISIMWYQAASRHEEPVCWHFEFASNPSSRSLGLYCPI